MDEECFKQLKAEFDRLCSELETEDSPTKKRDLVEKIDKVLGEITKVLPKSQP